MGKNKRKSNNNRSKSSSYPSQRGASVDTSSKEINCPESQNSLQNFSDKTDTPSISVDQSVDEMSVSQQMTRVEQNSINKTDTEVHENSAKTPKELAQDSENKTDCKINSASSSELEKIIESERKDGESLNGCTINSPKNDFHSLFSSSGLDTTSISVEEGQKLVDQNAVTLVAPSIDYLFGSSSNNSVVDERDSFAEDVIWDESVQDYVKFEIENAFVNEKTDSKVTRIGERNRSDSSESQRMAGTSSRTASVSGRVVTGGVSI